MSVVYTSQRPERKALCVASVVSKTTVLSSIPLALKYSESVFSELVPVCTHTVAPSSSRALLRPSDFGTRKPWPS